jgi:DNA ligase-1
MLLHSVAVTSADLATISARGAKVARLAQLLIEMNADEARPAVSWLTGELTQRQIGVGWAALRELPTAATLPSLEVIEVEAMLAEIGATSGPGSQARRRALVDALFRACTEVEQQFLRRLLSGDLRQGALAGVMTDAIARALNAPLPAVRRAAMIRGDLAVVAAAALSEGVGALARYQLQVGRAVSPMLAQTAISTDEALSRLGGRAALEWKLDGARVQIHRSGEQVSVFTRTLDDITDRVPEVVDAVRALPVLNLVADGEIIALRPDGRPYPFQVTAARFGTRTAGRSGRGDQPLKAFLFDVLHVDGTDLLDEPATRRMEELEALVPAAQRVPRLVTDDPATARRFFQDALDHGHEGVLVKSLTAPYEAGRRGSGWLKVKPVHTLDLVVLAVEWGSGRRKGWLSNIHLGARDEVGGGFVMLGKTFKGMTDEMLAWQTERFRSLATGPVDEWVVPVRPEQVVEIAFDGVQHSSRYPGGVALRFARVLRYRDEKTEAEADTLDSVRSFLAHD